MDWQGQGQDGKKWTWRFIWWWRLIRRAKHSKDDHRIDDIYIRDKNKNLYRWYRHTHNGNRIDTHMLYALKTCLYTPTGYRPRHRSVSSSPRFPPHPFSCTHSNIHQSLLHSFISFSLTLYLSTITHHRPIHRLFLYYRIVLLFNDPKVDQPRTVDCTWEFSYMCTRVGRSSSCVCVCELASCVFCMCNLDIFAPPISNEKQRQKTKQNNKKKRIEGNCICCV